MAGTTAIETSVPVELNEIPVDIPELAEPELVDDAPDPAIEARAREMGWKPLAEYRGPPGKWRPADEFIARGEEILPIVRDQNRRLTERLGKLEGEFSALRATAGEQLQIIKDLREMGMKADQRGYDRALTEIKTKQRQAVELGDTKAYDQLVEQAEALQESHAAAVPSTVPAVAAEPPARAPAVSEATKSFVAANAWFKRDKVLNQAMIAHHIEVLQEGQIVDETAQYEEAKQRVMDAYPDRFGVQPREAAPPPPRPAPRRRAAAVALPTPEPPPRPNGAGINSIADQAERADARAAYERFKRNMPDYTEAEFMVVYGDPHSDILTLQKSRTQPNGR